MISEHNGRSWPLARSQSTQNERPIKHDLSDRKSLPFARFKRCLTSSTMSLASKDFRNRTGHDSRFTSSSKSLADRDALHCLHIVGAITKIAETHLVYAIEILFQQAIQRHITRVPVW